MKHLSLLKVSLGLSALLMISGCGVGLTTSKAYKLGVVTGNGYKGVIDYAQVAQTYFPDATSDSSSPTPTDIASLCEALWPIVGLSAALPNTTQNQEDFKQGCVDGSK